MSESVKSGGSPAPTKQQWTLYPDLSGTGGWTVNAERLEVTSAGALIFSSTVGGVLTIERVFSPTSYGYLVIS
jgi:hypothetical protein